MGMFDTIYLDKEYTCPICQGKIESVQVKEFENILEDYHVKDCVSHAEEVRIIKDELFCNHCLKHTGVSIYIIVNRGILLGTTETLEEAKKLLSDLNPEKLILWYHDLYQRYIEVRREEDSYKGFLQDLREWYGERLYEKPEDNIAGRLWLIRNQRHLKGALNPSESIDRFLTYKKMAKTLYELWEEGYENLHIYYPEKIHPGEEIWSVDVYQDEVNERCDLNWTWTVMSKKELEQESEEERDLPEWGIVVDEPFSDQVICKAVEEWLNDRGYKFEVKMIPAEQAKGSGLLKKLNFPDLGEKRETISSEEMEKELRDEETRRIAALVQRSRHKEKVFYYKGFYGSLFPDVELNRLVGRIEGIKDTIIYEGKTVGECEQRFKEAVSEIIG